MRALLRGDCLEILKTFPENSIHACVTDPPAGIEFCGSEWDRFREGERSTGWSCGGKHGNNGFGGFATTLRPVFCYRTREDREAFIASMTEIFAEVLRVLRPGAFALVWALPRTSYWTAMALDEAGFDVKDSIAHLFGQGFKKSLDISKAMDKAAGAERKVTGVRVKNAQDIKSGNGRAVGGGLYAGETPPRINTYNTEPATEEAKAWEGFGTGIKPAHEVWWLVRKPLSEKTYVANVLRWGTGALNVKDTAIPCEPIRTVQGGQEGAGFFAPGSNERGRERRHAFSNDEGRWPPNLVLSHSPQCGAVCVPGCPVAELDRQSGILTSGAIERPRQDHSHTGWGSFQRGRPYPASEGGASRFYPVFREEEEDRALFKYMPKPSKREKEAGLKKEPDGLLHRVNSGGLQNDPRFAPVVRKNTHPTVKGVALMRWLIQLVNPPGGTVLDPFMGSGSTGVAAVQLGFPFIGIEQEEKFFRIATGRIENARLSRTESLFTQEEKKSLQTMSLFDEEEF